MESPSFFSVINWDRYFVFMVAQNQFSKSMLSQKSEALYLLSANFASRFSQAAKPE
jgi:hypothetical protein